MEDPSNSRKSYPMTPPPLSNRIYSLLAAAFLFGILVLALNTGWFSNERVVNSPTGSSENVGLSPRSTPAR